jgi:hypothetical protein
VELSNVRSIYLVIPLHVAVFFDAQHLPNNVEDLVEICMIHGPRKMYSSQGGSFSQLHLIEASERFRFD